MADVSDSDKSPRRDTAFFKTNMKGDGSARGLRFQHDVSARVADGPATLDRLKEQRKEAHWTGQRNRTESMEARLAASEDFESTRPRSGEYSPDH
ncbi:hypothetical protein NL676_011983 [Syzygium grande]|nr:hypothetical protein NL676_011983 [Syzygium grande]